MVIFAVGVALLCVVFVLAAVTFGQVPRVMGSPAAAERGSASILGAAAVRALLLFVMAYAGSLVASKGLELHMAGRRGGEAGGRGPG